VPTLPHRTILDLRKIEEYCLNPDHPRGRHKARVFREALGLARADAEWLSATFLAAIPDSQPVEMANDQFGQRWRLDIGVSRQGKRAVVRTVWMQRTDEDLLRFVTCWGL